ncbi:hypothetical protein BH10PLA2_BH10PLA2_32410 [soil metagenome]
MRGNRWFIPSAIALAVSLASGASVQAADLRYHYVPVDQAGNTQLTPVVQPGGGGSPGERIRFLGFVNEPVTSQPKPTHLVTFRHSFSGRNITVPLTLRPGTPRMSYNRDSILYNYGSESIEVEFNKDGSVDVIYSSGLLRRI